MNKLIENLQMFLDTSVNEYYASFNIAHILENHGFKRIHMNEKWDLKLGGAYYLIFDETSIIAFEIGLKSNSTTPFQIVASHLDSPVLKLKPNGIISNNSFTKLNTEVYGGPIFETWFDKPLGLAGRIFIKKGDGVESILVNTPNPITIIPTAPIHLKKDFTTNPQKDLEALVSLENEEDTTKLIKKIFGIKEEIVSFDLNLYNETPSTLLGVNKEMISSPRIDNLECAYTTLMGFLESYNDDNINIYVSYHNEEVGSLTKQGANSPILKNTLLKICGDEQNLIERLANSFMISADNAHAYHPNYPELYDPTNKVFMNKGVVLKHNSQTRYTTDALSEAVLKMISDKAGLTLQHYTNKSDIRGGSTLGAISMTHVNIPTVDIGLAQLAMHSTYETCGTQDAFDMVKLISEFYNSHIIIDNNKIKIGGTNENN